VKKKHQQHYKTSPKLQEINVFTEISLYADLNLLIIITPECNGLLGCVIMILWETSRLTTKRERHAHMQMYMTKWLTGLKIIYHQNEMLCSKDFQILLPKINGKQKLTMVSGAWTDLKLSTLKSALVTEHNSGAGGSVFSSACNLSL